MNFIETQCPAKINLFLRVLNKRIDGYHNIETSFQLVDLCDLMSFERTTDGIIIESNKDFLRGQDNTIFTSASKIKEYLSDQEYGVKISIQKNIPTGSGMGGGSSNAASTIIALNKLWNLNLSENKLISIAKEIGADVPFFMFGKNALGTGIGDELQETSSIKKNILVIDPLIHNSSKNMFNLLEEWKENKNNSLSKQNHFLNVFIEKNEEVKDFVKNTGKNYSINLTGSGSCMFICYKDDKEINEILKKIPSKWRLFFCKPLQYSPICYI